MRLLAHLQIAGDAYDLNFEYFMSNFPLVFMQKGGKYFTPPSIVKLILKAIEACRR